MNEYTVSEVVYKLKDIVENNNELIGCQVKGEITNFNGRYPSGHMYFSIKDEESSIACVMFASCASKLDFDLQNGDKVVLNATPSIYNKTGKLQLNVFSMKKDGVGDLLQKYEELKKKLTEQGYFNDDHKKQFEIEYPNSIGVIVGDNSAAMSDIKRTFARRWPLCNVEYYPSVVQGDKAPADLIKNLLIADKKGHDAIIIARGGGSFEDLFCFNDENLVKTIYDLKTFIISGVGHEQDFTLCDFVADQRASTPTASVELLTPDINEIIDEIDIVQDNIHKILKDRIDNTYQLLDNAVLKLNLFSSKIENLFSYLDSIRSQIKSDLKSIIKNTLKSIETNKDQLKLRMLNKLSILTNDINNKKIIIEAFSQENTLKRGYSIISKDNKIIKSSKELKLNDIIDIRLYKSKAKAEIKEA